MKTNRLTKVTIFIFFLYFLWFFNFLHWFFFPIFWFSHFATKFYFAIHKFYQWTQRTFLMILCFVFEHRFKWFYFVSEFFIIIIFDSETHFSFPILFRCVHFCSLFTFWGKWVHWQWFQSTFLFNHFEFHFFVNNDWKFTINIIRLFHSYFFLLLWVQS